MRMIHEYASRIDANLWNDIEKIKQMDGGTTSINSLVNEGLKMVRDKKMEELSQQRKRRNTLSAIVNW